MSGSCSSRRFASKCIVKWIVKQFHSFFKFLATLSLLTLTVTPSHFHHLPIFRPTLFTHSSSAYAQQKQGFLLCSHVIPAVILQSVLHTSLLQPVPHNQPNQFPALLRPLIPPLVNSHEHWNHPLCTTSHVLTLHPPCSQGLLWTPFLFEAHIRTRWTPAVLTLSSMPYVYCHNVSTYILCYYDAHPITPFLPSCM